MKTNHSFRPLFAGLLLLPLAGLAAPTDPALIPGGPADKTLAPHFIVLDAGVGEGDSEPLPLKHTDAKVQISGVIAAVEVRQVYRNTGSKVLEAIYVFPGSTRSAIHGMKMQIGERTVEAAIAERDSAKQQYEKAKAEHKTAALLEQKRPNVFQMNVGHILPGDDVTVTIRYTELLSPVDRVYEFVFPTVAGPRYSNRPEGKSVAAGDGWVGNPFLEPGVETPATFTLSIDLAAGLPVREVASPSHAIQVDYEAADRASIGLKAGETRPNDRDFVLRYRLAGERIASGLLLHEDADRGENFFLLTVQPPARVTPADLPGRDYLFVVDVSGSMNGFPLDTAKRLMRDLIGGLQPKDRFNVVLFAGDSSLLADRSLTAEPANLDRAIAFLDAQRGGGGTELGKALERALDLPREPGFSRSIVLATDGYVDFETETFQIVRERLNEGNLFALGIGSSVNRFLIEGLARAGQGEPIIVLDPAEAPGAADRLREMIAAPVLTNVSVDFGAEFQAYDVNPASLPDVFADRPLVVFGKYRGKPGGEIRVTGTSGVKERHLTLPVAPAAGSEDNHAAIPYLWARHRIAELSDDYQLTKDSETRTEVTNLGLGYHLLTPFTSFIAVDTEVRAPKDGADLQTTHQPSPLPQGVPVTAVSGGTVPEPGSILLWLTGLATLAWQRRRKRKAAANA